MGPADLAFFNFNILRIWRSEGQQIVLFILILARLLHVASHYYLFIQR